MATSIRLSKILLLLFVIQAKAIISGQISLDKTEVQATNVTYTFQLNFQAALTPSTAKIVIRFPADYTAAFNTNCAPLAGFSGTELNCTYLQTSRMLTFTGTAFPPTLNQLQFRVSGIVNPDSVRTTSFFFVSAYSQSGTTFVLKETGGSGLQITTTSGAITSQNLTLSDPTVGAYSDLTLSFVASHQVPFNGQITFTLPKWNQQNPIQANWVSLVSVPIAAGPISCTAISGLPSQFLTCQFTSGTSQDILVIQLYETQNITAGTNIQIVIQNVRAPPSLSPLSGFTLSTMTNSGQIIDQWKSQMSLTAYKAAISSSSSVSLIVSPTTISAKSSVQFTIQNTNPLLPGSQIQITIPLDFNVTRVDLKVTTSGQSLVSQPAFTFSGRNIQILAFNSAYLESLSVSYINIQGLTNPAQTGQSASFGIMFYDPNNEPVEYVSSGITFSATPGSFSSVSVTASNLQVSAINVYYTFQLLPQHSFSSAAILKLTFPSDFWVNPSGFILNQSGNMGPSPQIKTLYNSEVYIKQAFPNGYSPSSPIVFTLTGITNPITVQKTQPIFAQVFYDEDYNQIDNYFGNEMTITARPAAILSISAELSNRFTGQLNDYFTITGSTPLKIPIAQGASLLVFIPGTFKITDPIRVASSCTAISGFSDQISCYFVSTSSDSGSYLVVTQGFSSKTFPGGSFSFSISEVMNPFNSAVSKPFTMEVYDSFGQLEYTVNPSNDPFTLYANPTSFAFAFVSSSSDQNGESSIYTFSITLNIDTPSGTTLQVNLPPELQFDSSMPFLCNGKLEIDVSAPCYYRNGRSINLVLMPESLSTFMFKNGTTIGFTLGYIFNSFSLAPTGSFGLSTFTLAGNQGTEYIYINQQLSGLKITNQVPGQITINNITQIGSKELNQPTKLSINLTSTNAIPAGAVLSIILPTNFQFQPSVSVFVNNKVATDASINTKTFTLTFTVPQDTNKNFFISINSGLVNPKTGPYGYAQFGFQFTFNKYTIDNVLSNRTWISVLCGGNCTACQGSLNGCQTCGLLDTEAFYLFNKTCLSQCPAGYYGGAGYECLPCKSPCAECSVGAEMCTRCDPTKGSPFVALSTLSCYNQCPSGTYLNATISQCVQCQSPCYSCASPTKCLTCDLNNPKNTAVYFFGQNSSCLKQCPAVSVPSPSKVCVDCESPCKTCTQSPDNCLTCIAGLYIYKNQCVSNCPFNYYSDNTSMQCKAIASLKIPFPFTIIAFVISVGIGMASFMKGNHKSGQGTAFFITCIAFVDIILRANWFVLGVLSLQQGYFYTFFGCAIILTVSLFLNLGVWRRFFKFKYNLDENDKLYVQYSHAYPRTSKWILFISYSITFQAFRLSYSRLLGKKQFCAEFTRSRVYYRLIGRLSIMAIMFLYLPAIALNFYGLAFMFKMGDQIFYIGLDSLALVAYATVLIIVTLTQREKLLDQKDLFKFGELCRCNVPSDDEKMYENEDGGGKGGRNSPTKVMATFEDSMDGSARVTQHLDEIELDVMSATGYDQIKKQKLYQTELRKEHKSLGLEVNLLDYTQYRNLEEKVNRIVLKRNLYENRRMNDYNQLQNRRSDLSTSLQHNEVLLQKLEKLRRYLQHIQAQIEKTEFEKTSQVKDVEQRKREEKVKNTSETSQHPFTLNSVQGSISTPHQQLFNLDLQQHSTEEDPGQRQSREDTEEQANGPQTTEILTTNQERLIGTTESQEEEEDSILREFGQQRQSFGPNASNRKRK